MAVKEYTVKKDGKVLKTYRSLPSAKQLAEKELANVYCDGICVYKVVPEEKDYVPDDEKAEGEPEDKIEEKSDSTAAERFTLTALMNVRKEPSFHAEILGTMKPGTVVDVESITDDWLYLTDGTFIFYNGGKFAERR